MSKNIVLCCDGTGNDFHDPSTNSNVVKLYGTLKINQEQFGYYHPGVGTMGSPKARGWFEQQASRIWGLATGAGLLDNVGDAYRYLMNTYADGDRIYIFGFSRGAYTARAIASVLHVFGLCCAGNEGLIPYILRMYAQRSRQEKRKKATFDSENAFKQTFSHKNEVNVHFCGVWDTVSSYGWVYSPINLPYAGRNPIILTGRHAISIHERRCYYHDNLWGHPFPGQDLRQVWFSGVHSDIGGSYFESESGLSKISLEWMLVEAEKAGLLIDSEKVQRILGRDNAPGEMPYAAPDANADLHTSLQGAWWIPEFLPERNPHTKGSTWRWPLGHYRIIPENSVIHESVFQGKWKPESPPPHSIEPWVPYPHPATQ
ncbi:DUF2235 domain-containing protein [Acidobacterium sp. S8]|uniref:T6SS phospholipase effector Tle1-like catalytic domain-containing protein n=1 Tax=Acidobacterium sp. S8 TaxID=1641854 RepID=UPI00131D0A8E|nr:DUF2235 domain-containing protein [Acidobacterium sp. S8]